MAETLAPTQLAYDRIQRAASRSPTNFPAVYSNIRHELCPEGIKTVGNTTGRTCSHITMWTELARCNVDPLWYAYVKVATDLGIELNDVSPEMGARHAGL